MSFLTVCNTKVISPRTDGKEVSQNLRHNFTRKRNCGRVHLPVEWERSYAQLEYFDGTGNRFCHVSHTENFETDNPFSASTVSLYRWLVDFDGASWGPVRTASALGRLQRCCSALNTECGLRLCRALLSMSIARFECFLTVLQRRFTSPQELKKRRSKMYEKCWYIN